MNPIDKAQIISRYRDRLRRYGEDIRTLASGTRERQQIRFAVLSAVGDLEGASVLDLGCGFGHFYEYLINRGLRVDYTGYDICPDFVELASAKFPQAKFEVRDIQVDGIPRQFDYIISSQTFNNKLEHEDNFEVVKDVIRRCYEASEKAVAIDMLTSHVDFREDHLYYYSPEQVFSFCKTLTKRVVLRHDYPLFEFTMYLYKDFVGWRAREQNGAGNA